MSINYLNFSSPKNNQENTLPQSTIVIPSTRLYPEIPSSYSNKNTTESIINNFNTNNRKSHNICQINENFFGNLLKNSLSKKIVCNTINKFIIQTGSNFMEKIKNESSEFNSEEKEPKNLSLSVVQKMSYCEFKKGKTIFKVGELKDKLFFVIKGKILSFKPKKVTEMKMSLREYLSYCLLLVKNKEDFLLNKILEANSRLIPVISTEEIKNSFKILFKTDLCKHITNKSISNNKELLDFFNSYLQDLESYNLKMSDLEILRPTESKNRRRMSTAKIQKPENWENYILKKCKPKLSETNYFEKFDEILKIPKIPGLLCYIFSFDKIYESGSYFGGIPLTMNEKKSSINNKDLPENIRQFTVIAEEDCFLGWIKNDDFMDIVAPMKKQEKLNDLSILCSNYFLKGINMEVFDKNYYHLFKKKEYSRDKILFERNKQPNLIYLLKRGTVSLNINCSIFELNNIINFLFNKLINCPSYKELLEQKILTKNKVNAINQYCTEPCLKNMRMHSEKFIKEVNKIRNYQIANIYGTELIGVHEIYFNIPYVTNCIVSCEKIVCFELSLEGKDIIITKEKNNCELYTKCAVNKLLSIIERIQNIKRNLIDMLIAKYEKPALYEMNNSIELNTERNVEKTINFNENMQINSNNERYKETIDVNDSNISLFSNVNFNSPKRLRLNFEGNKMKKLLIENQKENSQIINSSNSIKKLNRSMANSTRKPRKRIKIGSLSDVYFKERAGSVDLQKLNQHNNLKNKCMSRNDIDVIFVGDKYMTLNELEKYTNKNFGTIVAVRQNTYKLNIKNNKNAENYEEDSDISRTNKITQTENNNINKKFITIAIPSNLRILTEIQNNRKLNFNSVPLITCTDEKKKRFNSQNIFNNINVITSKETKLLPKILLKGGFSKNTKDNNKIVSQSIDYLVNRFKAEKKIFAPMMVKEYYDNIKKKGCIPFIGNKKSNTIFLRKFRKKYNETNSPKFGENIMSNELPRINRYYTKNIKLNFLNANK